MRSRWYWLLVAAAVSAPPAAADPPPGRPAEPRLILFGSWRLRQEYWNWFDDGDQGRYSFTGSLLRFGGSYVTPRFEATLELEQPTLANLPRDASLAPPLGQLGLGAAYRDANLSQEASLFVKQAFVRVRAPGTSGSGARLGRLEFIDGAETSPKDPSLAWMKRERIAHRLLGTFGFTHVGRSFDGGEAVYARPDFTVTLFAGMPTQGVFNLDGGGTLDEVKVGYAAVTRPLSGTGFQGDARVFGLHYRDERSGVVKQDNRPERARAADKEPVAIHTVGGHFLGLWETAGGKLDGLLWAAGQWGDFGSLSHEAFSLAAELGFQPNGVPGSCWFRVGFLHASGDGDPADGDHGTFFPVLPTPRLYARFPFYTNANLNDAFAQVIFKPAPGVTVRSDLHALWLADAPDLWYVGGGAFERSAFGFGGRPSGNHRGLATLLDVSVDWQWRKDTALTGYLGYAWGGDVIRSIYGGRRSGLFGYVELIRRF
jgi:hypothetical protein